MESGAIPDNKIFASSKWNNNSLAGAHRGRLHLQEDGSKTGGWVAETIDNNQWLGVKIDSGAIITGLATQGRQDDQDWWVTEYKFKYNFFGIGDYYKEPGQTEAKVNRTLINVSIIDSIFVTYPYCCPKK